jgi:vacuolar protein sorting-associated protein 13A/C
LISELRIFFTFMCDTGARADGVEGFFKGFGKGILGLVTRPTVGVFDMVSTTLDGIKR